MTGSRFLPLMLLLAQRAAYYRWLKIRHYLAMEVAPALGDAHIIPFEIRRLKFKVSWLYEDHIAAGTFVMKGSRQRALTAPSLRCRRTIVFKDWNDADRLPQVGWRFADGNGYRSSEPMDMPSAPSSHSKCATVFCVVLLWVGFSNLGHRCLHSSCPMDFNKRRRSVVDRLLANKLESDRPSSHFFE
jgi:hypothetical protein